MNLVKMGDDRLERLGDTRTFVFEGESFTALQINAMGRRLAGGLKSLGIGRGDHVVVSLSNSPKVFACFGAIWRLGAVIVPIMAFVVRTPGQDIDEGSLFEFAKSRMTPFKAPSRVQFVDGLPKSLVGKVLKKELIKFV